jgi:hypothetical protein
MIDLGYTYDGDTEVQPVKSGKKTKHFPTVWINDGQELPLDGEDVGKTFRITGTIRLTGVEERIREGQKKKGMEFNFELRSIQIHNERNKLKKALKRNLRP